jgi:hypothetical protein
MTDDQRTADYADIADKKLRCQSLNRHDERISSFAVRVQRSESGVIPFVIKRQSGSDLIRFLSVPIRG